MNLFWPSEEQRSPISTDTTSSPSSQRFHLASEALRDCPQETKSEGPWGYTDRDHAVVIPHILYRVFLRLSNGYWNRWVIMVYYNLHRISRICFGPGDEWWLALLKAWGECVEVSMGSKLTRSIVLVGLALVVVVELWITADDRPLLASDSGVPLVQGDVDII